MIGGEALLQTLLLASPNAASAACQPAHAAISVPGFDPIPHSGVIYGVYNFAPYA